MGIEKIGIDLMAQILERVLKSHSLFSDYLLISQNIQKITNPTKIIENDFIFVSEKCDRWLFIGIQDFSSHQKLIIKLNQLNAKKNINLDIQEFYVSFLKNNTVKQKMIFKSTSGIELESHLENIFKYLISTSNAELIKIIKGEIWIDMPIDWGNYK